MQVNITIPDEWKTKLDKIARKIAYEEDRDYSYLDVIRDSIKNHCEILNNELIKKNTNDPIGYIENLKIIHPDKALIDFKLHDYQKRYIKFIEENQFVIGCKFRQGGFTTMNAAYSLWKCIHFPNTKIIFATKTEREAYYINKIIKVMIDYLPIEIKPNVTKLNDHIIELDNKSSIFSANIEICCNALNGCKISNLFIEEAAFIGKTASTGKKMEDYWIKMFPVIEKCVIMSTTNGTNNWFYDVYNDAKSKTNSFKVFECSYLENPEFTVEYINEMRKGLSEKGFSQEIECCFISD
jgi:hypothetical protein